MIEFNKFPSIDPENTKTLLSIASGPVIIQDSKVLLDKHGDDNFWKFPGGRMHDDESMIETAKREVKEELGVDVQIDGKPFVISFTRGAENKTEYVVLFHYKAELLNETITPGRDVREWQWIAIDDLPEDVAPNIKPAVEHFKRIT
ncbi:NUDIX hydrolase [Patescibacteria group bacterium]|nr:NUDIX hydrolase [Patescibacteria group bacterium]